MTASNERHASLGKHVRACVGSLAYILLNYLVAYIPSWHVRRLFYTVFGMRIGRGSRINMGCKVWNPKGIRIGDDSIVNEHAMLDGRGGLTIGDSTSIAMWSVLYTASHYVDSPTFEYYTRPTVIGNCCWVCARAIVLPGSELADKTIISAGSVYKGKSTEAGIYAGIPAKLVRQRQVEEPYRHRWITHFR